MSFRDLVRKKKQTTLLQDDFKKKQSSLLTCYMPQLPNDKLLPVIRKSKLPNSIALIENTSTTLALRSNTQANSNEIFKLRTAPADHSAASRALRDEKALFIKKVWEAHIDLKISEPAACEFIAKNFGHDFPHLSTSGKKGSSSLKYNNYRNWVTGTAIRPGIGRLLDRTPNFHNIDLLLDNYGCESTLYGDPAFWRALASAYLRNSEAKISKTYCKLQLKWMLESPEQLIPTLAQVRYFYKNEYPKRFLNYTRKGENYFYQHYMNFISRDPNSIRPNEAWVADTQDCDFTIRVEKTPDELKESKDKSPWKVIRPKIMVIMDIKSEHVISCQLIFGSCSNEVIRNGFAAGVKFYGRPKIFLTDNGSDYLADGFTTPVIFVPNMDGSIVYEHSIMKELDVEHHRATSYNARAKYVERFFREMAEYARDARGYVGNKPSSRPADADVWAKPQNREYLMDKDEACRFISGNINLYHLKPSKDSKFLNGLSPAQAFTPSLRYTRANLSDEEYMRAFRIPYGETRIVNNVGPSVRHNNKRYVAVPEEAKKLWMYDKKHVMLKFEMFTDEHCFVYDLDGTYICECRTPELMPYFADTIEAKEKLSQHLELIRAEKKYLDTMLMDLTGGWHRVDAMTTYQLPREAFLEKPQLKLLDSRFSVKGETHNPRIYIPKDEYQQHQLNPPIPQNQMPKKVHKKRNLELEQDIERRLLANQISNSKQYDLSAIDQEKNQQTKGILDENFI